MDELAHRLKADPVAYRSKHLRDPRLRHVLAAAAKAAGWQPRPSPRAHPPGPGALLGRGVACVLYEGDNGYCAMVAEVLVDPAEGALEVKRLVVALDCGPVSNPDGLRNQVEGGALQGISRALGEEVTWDDRRVTSIDWASYRSLSLGYAAPLVETVLVDSPDAAAAGAGETSITVTAAALGNAIFDATGVRVRQLPFTRERLKAALQARA
jgi:CO/xanthine dehydrogenase Mo-binding subunit